ncbi:MAG: serine hydrolase [Lachnospiraceae bacterium]|nr:serine hydrolase [Lachnospiraceae bacterium]
MEPYLDDRDEEREFRIRYERRRRMRLERQRRIRRQRMLKRLLCLIGLIVLAVFIGFVIKHGRKQEADKFLSKEQSAGTARRTGVPDMAGTEGEIPETEISVSEPEEERLAYSFESTPDTVTIYDEEVISTNAILVDESADIIIASKGADERIYPASMTKVLTVLVAAEQIKEENLDDTFTMTLEITDYAYVHDCSSVGFLNGEEVTVRDLFYGAVLPSGGDAALGLAIYTAGSHEAFVDMMNAKLEELGIADSAHFTNCIGLYDENHYCTVYDMAIIMKAAMQNELCREFLSAHIYTTAPTEQHPDGITMSNWFLRRIEDKETGGEVLCAKTGYITQARNCAVSYGIFAGGTPYICVTVGSTSVWRCIYDHVEIYNRYIPA